MSVRLDNCRAITGLRHPSIVVLCGTCVAAGLGMANVRTIGILSLGAMASWGSVAHAASLTLAWNANTDGNTSGYVVYWGNKPGVYVSSLDVGNQTTRTLTGLVDGSPYYFVVRAYNSSGMLSGPSVEVSRRVGVPYATPADFSGDLKADVTVFRPSNGTWYTWVSGSAAVYGIQWGGQGDVPVPGDYDGDGRIDVAVFRPSDRIWYLRYSSNAALTGIAWGGVGDKPLPGDYDGDGRADAAVFRPSNGVWYVRHSTTGAMWSFQWGSSGDVPVHADYDGDGKTDIAVFRPSNATWYLRFATGATAGVVWGGGTDKPVPADFDGDGRADIAVFRPSDRTWYFRYATGVSAGLVWGAATDIPIPNR